jgi:ribosome-associated toxin RatA of RatAB toxin-antitoxin module
MLLLSLWLVAATETAKIAEPAAAAPLPDVAAGSCVCCGADSDSAIAHVASEEWLLLQNGGVLKRRTGRVESAGTLRGGAEASGLVAYPPDQVWAVLTDFTAWPRFMPHVTATEITQEQGRKQWVRSRFRILMTTLGHTTIYELDPRHGRLSWQLDMAQAHDIAGSSGVWELSPANGGESTLVRYASELDSGRDVPGFIERMLFERSIDELFAGLRSELARRASPAR